MTHRVVLSSRPSPAAQRGAAGQRLGDREPRCSFRPGAERAPSPAPPGARPVGGRAGAGAEGAGGGCGSARAPHPPLQPSRIRSARSSDPGRKVGPEEAGRERGRGGVPGRGGGGAGKGSVDGGGKEGGARRDERRPRVGTGAQGRRRPREPGAALGACPVRPAGPGGPRGWRRTSSRPAPLPLPAETRGSGPRVIRPRFLRPQMLRAPAVLCVCAAAWCAQALAAAAGRPAGGNFLDDKQWLSTVSQYDREAGQWNRFRDVSRRLPALERAARGGVGVGLGRGGEVGALEAAPCWGVAYPGSGCPTVLSPPPKVRKVPPAQLCTGPGAGGHGQGAGEALR